MKAKSAGLILSVALLSNLALADGLKETSSKVNAGTIAALKKNDIKAFDQAVKPFVTPDFKYMEEGRSMSYKQMVDEMKLGMGQVKRTKVAEVLGIKISQKGDMGTIAGTHHLIAEIGGQDKKTHVMEWSGLGTEAWVKTKQGWKMKSLTFSKQKTTLDGKPMKM